MRVAIHLGTLRGHGSGRVGRNVLTKMVHHGPEHRWLAWVPDSWTDEVSVDRRLDVRRVRSGALWKFVSENVDIRMALKRWPADRLFSLGDTSLPRSPVPHLLLVHQPYLAFDDEARGFPVPIRLRVKLKLMEAYFRAGMSSVDHFTVQTPYMKRRLASRFDIADERITVVPSAVEEVPQAECEPASGRPYICYIASPAAHKNHVVLAGMMDVVRRRYPEVVCKVTVYAEDVPALASEARRRGLVDSFEFLGPVPYRRAIALQRRAAVAVIPSWIESFGLPYYEALALGCPVVAADREHAHDACGAAALYADPTSGEDFATAVLRLLDDPSLAGELRRSGQRRHRQAAVSWDAVAKAYTALLAQLER